MSDEPKVRAPVVRDLLLRHLRLDEESAGESVAVLAERTGVSTRTIYRVLDADGRPTLSLDLADRLLLGIGEHLAFLPDDALVD